MFQGDSAQQSARRPFRFGRGWLVVLVLVVWVLAGQAVQRIPAIGDLFVALPVVVAFFVVMIGALIWSIWFWARGRSQSDQVDPTVTSWALENGWDYRPLGNVDAGALAASGMVDARATKADDAICGEHDGRAAWAFVAHMLGSMQQATVCQVVVMRLLRPWPGRLRVASSADACGTGFDGEVVPLQDGFVLGSSAFGGGTQEIVAMLSGAGFPEALSAAGLPGDFVFEVWGGDGSFAVLRVAWEDDPEHILPAALDLLARLATILEADAARRPESWQTPAW